MKRKLLFTGLLATLALPVCADTTLTYVNEAGQPAMLVQVADGNLRVEDHGANTLMLYDTANDTMTMVDTAQREYSVLDPAARQKLKEKMGGAMAKMRAQLESMPPEQRKMMEGMMGGLMKAVEPSVEKTGNMQTVAGYECEVIRIRMGDEITSQACVADPDAVDMPASDYATFRRMGESLQQMAEDILQGLGGDFSALNELDGVAVRTSDDSGTKILDSVSHAAIPASAFSVPDGYTRTAIDQ